MTSFSLHEKVSGHEIKEWYLSTLKLEVDTMDGEAAWESFMDHKPVDFKAPKKPRTSKKSSTPAERSDAPYNEDKCDARVYKAGGWGCQCSCKKVDGQSLCKRHQTEADGHGGMVKNGFVTSDRPTHHYGDESLTLITWHDVEVPTKVKKVSGDKKKVEKKVSTRKCSICGEVGHNKSKCPNKSKCEKHKTVADIKAELAEAEAKEAEAEAEAEAKAQSEVEKTKKVSKNAEKISEAQELDEDDDDATQACEGSEVGVDPTETYEGDVANLEDVVETDIEFTFEGVTYTRNEKDNVVCDDDYDEVGKWNMETESIEFTKLGLKQHKHHEDRVEENVEESVEESVEENVEEE